MTRRQWIDVLCKPWKMGWKLEEYKQVLAHASNPTNEDNLMNQINKLSQYGIINARWKGSGSEFVRVA